MKRVNRLAFFLFLTVGLMIFHLLIRSGTFEKDVFASCAESLDLRTCREKYVISVLKKSGTRRAFLIIEQLKKQDSVFAVECHAFSHTIGVAAYPLLISNIDVFSVPISACEIGYIHGLMMEIVMHKGELDYAEKYCEKLRSYAWRDRIYLEQCYHGVGHGLPLYLAFNGDTDKKVIVKNDLYGLIDGGFELCNKHFNSEWECKRGVFGGIANILMGNHGVEVKNVKISDVFRVCLIQPENLRKSCYEMMAPALMQLTQLDVKRSIELSRIYIKNPNDLVYMAQPLGSSITTSINNASPLIVANICRSFKETNAVNICIEGYATSIVDATVISDFEKDILSVCDAGVLSEDEYLHCRAGALSQAKGSISESKFKILCTNLNEIEKKSFCKN